MGLHIDAGRLAAVKLNREDRVCQVCHALAVEDEKHYFCTAQLMEIFLTITLLFSQATFPQLLLL